MDPLSPTMDPLYYIEPRAYDDMPYMSLTATYDQDDLQATITLEQGSDKTVGTWTVEIDSFDKDSLCPDGDLNWHVHERGLAGGQTSPTDCGATGGHWDPTFGCGGASQYKATVCEDLVALGRVNPQSCMVDMDVSKCEMGDQSGKLGQIEIKEGTQEFEDPYISNIELIEGFAVVLHCGSPRKACANLM